MKSDEEFEALEKWTAEQRLNLADEKITDIEAIEIIKGCNKYGLDLPAKLLPFVVKYCGSWEDTHKQETRNNKTEQKKCISIFDVRCRMKQGKTKEKAMEEVSKYSGYTIGTLDKLYTEYKDTREGVDMLFPEGWEKYSDIDKDVL